jgi:hypothetical protein
MIRECELLLARGFKKANFFVEKKKSVRAAGFIRGVVLKTEFSIAESFFTATWQAHGSVGYVRQVQVQKVVLVSSESRK